MVFVAAIAGMLGGGVGRASLADFHVFQTRESYSAVLLQEGRVQTDVDWNEEGPIDNGETLGIFRFAFDSANVHLAVVPAFGIVGGLAIGDAGSENGTLGGGDGFTLRVTPGIGLTAFGAIVAFEDPSLRDYFRLVVGCPDEPCIFAPASHHPPALTDSALSTLDPGTFFLGVIAPPGLTFDTVRLEAVIPEGGDGSTVPGWQVVGITYVPEPATLALLGPGLIGLAAVRRRKR